MHWRCIMIFKRLKFVSSKNTNNIYTKSNNNPINNKKSNQCLKAILNNEIKFIKEIFHMLVNNIHDFLKKRRNIVLDNKQNKKSFTRNSKNIKNRKNIEEANRNWQYNNVIINEKDLFIEQIDNKEEANIN